MKKEKALELLSKFPELTDELETKIKQQLWTFILYDHKGNTRCTNCGKSPEMEQFGQFDCRREADYPECCRPTLFIDHRQEASCPECGKPATLIDCTNRYAGRTIESETNVMVIMSSPGDENLYIRCFTLRMFFEHGSIIPVIRMLETQRYVFTQDGAARYGRDVISDWSKITSDNGKTTFRCARNLSDKWVVRTRITYPIFLNKAGYTVMNKESVLNTCCRYSGLDIVEFDYTVDPINYLMFWQKHKGIERLVKCGLQEVVSDCLRYHSKSTIQSIHWKENEPHKMLGISRSAFAAIRNNKISLTDYRTILKEFPDETLENLIVYNHIIRCQFGTLESVCQIANSSRSKIIKYLKKQDVTIDIYRDYLRMSREQHADMNDKAVLFPKNLVAAHDRRVEARQAIERERIIKQNKKLAKKMEGMLKKRKMLEYSEGEYIIRQPVSAEEIVAEGAALSHCVGGYAARHAEGRLTIMFLRRKTEPDKPYYTIEVSTEFKIVQCRGYKNNVVLNGGEEKPEEIIQLERHYQQYLNSIKSKKVRKTA